MISIQHFCCFWILVAFFSVFQVVVSRSCRAFGDLLRINFLRSFFPSANCFCALSINSSSVLMLLATRNLDIPIFCNLLAFRVDKLLVKKLRRFRYDSLLAFIHFLVLGEPTSCQGVRVVLTVNNNTVLFTKIFICCVVDFATFRRVDYDFMV